jgi:hypothetical protein
LDSNQIINFLQAHFLSAKPWQEISAAILADSQFIQPQSLLCTEKQHIYHLAMRA